ncbi:MAG TPA: ACT domain-containing protein [Thermoanaerobaculia bacterium]|nr:ACT domain-containing protein [Thermoanaerobaculia bacterium]
MTRLRIAILSDRLAVCRLPPSVPLPSWIGGAFTSVTRTSEELSIVCDELAPPDDVQAERGWRLLRVEGPIPFEVTGIAAALVTPLAEAHISVFLLATYDTDYLLLKDETFSRAIDVLRAAGHDVA